MNKTLLKGALAGVLVGVVVLGLLYLVTGSCLPYLISEPTTPWPWYCSSLPYTALTYLSFPINVLTNDLASAARLAPLTLIVYGLIGAFIASRRRA